MTAHIDKLHRVWARLEVQLLLPDGAIVEDGRIRLQDGTTLDPTFGFTVDNDDKGVHCASTDEASWGGVSVLEYVAQELGVE